ncbi:mitochondrial ribosomal protein 10 [Ascobolus immersus RN42]|uniref:Small ribosomal subunit protein mS37 n=1 Tax=Ascobolus immersus RN42 TaxID=1160509 RepID=A0A3N4I5M1_ASCIM|nr:mitochondrial ribosomal protein 10 [Ascobolus immersus RN42]
MSAKDKVFRLPPLPKLRVRHPDKQQPQPCLAVMSALLGCWASQGQMAEGCAKLEESLRVCMDTQAKVPHRKSTINYHLARLYPKLSGPKKR